MDFFIMYSSLPMKKIKGDYYGSSALHQLVLTFNSFFYFNPYLSNIIFLVWS